LWSVITRRSLVIVDLPYSLMESPRRSIDRGDRGFHHMGGVGHNKLPLRCSLYSSLGESLKAWPACPATSLVYNGYFVVVLSLLHPPDAEVQIADLRGQHPGEKQRRIMTMAVKQQPKNQIFSAGCSLKYRFPGG
jgi:hypothetical protein